MSSDRRSAPGEVERLKVHQCNDYAEFISVAGLRSGGGLTRVAVDGTTLRAA
jgi:hypothetical protein